MTLTLDDTIAAVASAPGGALRAIIRISGAGMMGVLENVLDADSWDSNRPGRSARRHAAAVRIAEGRLQLPVSLLLWPTNKSFTGEPLAELHLPGSAPLVNEVLEQVLISGARPAGRGEFTLRAFLAGRIDLVQAEAVLGVIDAGNANELQTALTQLAGGISHSIADTQEQLLLHLADLEAGLDFVDEDIEFVAREELLRRLEEGRNLVQALLQQVQDRMQSTGRPKVVLAGLPNAGKSTLLNRLAGREAALVSHIAGTTRDYLAVPMSSQGISWELIDTAGWERARDEIESAADSLRDEQYRGAQLIVWCSAADLTPEEQKRDDERFCECRSHCQNVLRILTKSDCQPQSPNHTVKNTPSHNSADAPVIAISAEQGAGLDLLLRRIVSGLSTGAAASDIISSTAARCGESLRLSLEGMERALALVSAGAGEELIAVELREVLEHLGRIVGRVYTDDILDRIFSRFCIGK